MNINRAVYVLCAPERSVFFMMLYTSVRFLKYHHPDIKITLLTDKFTFDHTISKFEDLVFLLDEIKTLKNFYGTDFVMMSRHFKTTLIEYFTEPFIYIDVDAFVVKPIEYLLNLETDFAACQDGNCDPREFILPDFERKPFEALGWDVPEGEYYNSGVMVIGNTATAQNLFSTWHRLWKISSSNGHFKDQPPLNISLRKHELKIAVLPPQYNFLLGMYRGGAYRPHIVHFSTVNFEQRFDTVFHDLVRRTVTNKSLSDEQISDICNKEYFWTDRKSLKNILASRKWSMLPSAVAHRIFRFLSNRSKGA